MRPAVCRVTVRDLRGGPRGICRAFVYCCIACAVLLADRCGSFAQRLANLCRFLLPPAHFSLVVGIEVSMGQVSCFH